ncbi:MAG: hypothetical protein ACTSSE_17635 [Candidatus Thorarchaeota archaeon]
MKITKKSLTILSALVLVFIIAFPLITTTVDAASVLEKEAAATASIGDTFEILARGRGGYTLEDIEEFKADYLTNMTLEFTITRRGERGVLLEVLDGSFSLNDTTFGFDEGLGIAGRPEEGRFNGTIVFGFRINVTGPNGEVAQLEFRGIVKRIQEHGPLLIMQGRLVLEDQIFVFRQFGRIHRI